VGDAEMNAPTVGPFGNFRPAGGGERDDGFVQSVARGLSVIQAFKPGQERLTMAQIANVCQLTRAGVRRILLTLEDLGYVGQDGRHFYLTARILDLSKGYARRSLWEAARPRLQAVADELNETVSAGVLEGLDVVYMLRIPSSRLMFVDLEAGARLPAYVTTMGRVLLASLPADEFAAWLQNVRFERLTPHTVSDRETLLERVAEVRAQGWACARGEVDEAVWCASVPLTDRAGRTLAALHVSISANRASDAMIERQVVPALQAAARDIAGAI
jgi:IclR family transcriptional regulator, pca regulon regulatory protein